MKKILVGILLGLVLGAGVMWLIAKRSSSAAAAKPAEAVAKPEEKPNPLCLPPAKRTAAGIALAKPVDAISSPEVQAFGRVLDPAPLAGLLADVETAKAASTASGKELERTQKLFESGANASAQAVETAEANAARDRSVYSAAVARLQAGWGRELAGRAAEVEKSLEDGATLVRLDVWPGEPVQTSPKSARLILPGGTSAEVEVLGPAPVADPQIQGVCFIARMRGVTLPAGTALRAVLPGAGLPAQVLTVPRAAIIYHQGSAWVYVLGEEDTFARKLVTITRLSSSDDIVAVKGVEPEEQVAIAGAQQLLAAELQSGGGSDED